MATLLSTYYIRWLVYLAHFTKMIIHAVLYLADTDILILQNYIRLGLGARVPIYI